MLQRLLSLGILTVGFVGVAAADVTINDGTFNPLHWQHDVLWSRPTASQGPPSQMSTGGNPTFHQRMSHQTVGVNAAIYGGHMLTFQPYNPGGACNSIREFDVSYDWLDLGAGGVQTGLAVRQGSSTFVHFVDGSGPHTAWRTLTRGGIRQSSTGWRRVDPVVGLTAGQPNYSSSGGLMTFGYYAFSSSGPTGMQVQREWGIDNFRVIVKPCACDLDQGTGPRVCDVFDFLTFSNLFHAGSPCACNYDRTTGNNVCDVFDFLAFSNAFSAGCN